MSRRWLGPAHEAPLFHDRREAGQRLGRALERYRGQGVLVLAVPRGGVPVAAEVARHLGADLDVVVARKLGAPTSGELAIGAVTASGGRFLNAELVRELGVPDDYLRAITAAEMAEAERRERRFRGISGPPAVRDRIVILVDDGLATGATVRAAARAVREQGPRRLVVAVPVGSRQACQAMRGEADEVVCLHEPDPFFAVGLFYERFEPTADEDVQALLEEARAARPRADPQAP
jgi:predicted phosphoribosyltransferase